MTSVSFLVRGETNDSKAMAWVTIDEVDSGALLFKVKQLGGSMGKLHGLYFEIADNEILNTLRTTTGSCDWYVNRDEVVAEEKFSVNGEFLQSNREMHREQSSAEPNATGSYSFKLYSAVRALAVSDFSKIHVDCQVDKDCFGDQGYSDDESSRWLYMGLL